MKTTDINNEIKQLMQVCSIILEQDITQIKGFSSRKLGNIANQIIIISYGISNGQINDFDKESNFNYIIHLIDIYIQELDIKNIALLQKLIQSLNEYCYTTISNNTDLSFKIVMNNKIYTN